ncbi:MAG TPA: hypothetical protein VMY37_38555 [Thermoguttaceae bacterium]|nr:hypothetical protein [Thermoguttaceae bacterium]
MFATDDNPYRSPNEPGREARKSTFGGGRVIWMLLSIQFLATLNWGVAVAWLYWEALQPGYPFCGHPPREMFPYLMASFWVSVFFLPMPIVLGVSLAGLRKGTMPPLRHLAVCAASLILSLLQLLLLRVVTFPPIHSL